MDVWRTSQYWSKAMKEYSSFFDEPLLRKMQHELGLRVKKRKSKEDTCESDADRKGGQCLGNVVRSPDSFQSMDEKRDRYGGSDLLLFDKKEKFIAYTFFEPGDEEPRFWFRDMQIAVLEFNRRLEAKRCRRQQRCEEEESARYYRDRDERAWQAAQRYANYNSRSGNRTPMRGNSRSGPGDEYYSGQESPQQWERAREPASYIEYRTSFPGPTSSESRGGVRDYARNTGPRTTYEREYRREH